MLEIQTTGKLTYVLLMLQCAVCWELTSSHFKRNKKCLGESNVTFVSLNSSIFCEVPGPYATAYVYKCKTNTSINMQFEVLLSGEIVNCQKPINDQYEIFWIYKLFNGWLSVKNATDLFSSFLKEIFFVNVDKNVIESTNIPLSTQSIKFVNNNLMEIPALKQSESIERIEFRNQQFSDQLLSINLQNLHTLRITESGLNRFDLLDIKSNKKLSNIDFGYNIIETVMRGILPPTVISLKLNHNRIKKIVMGVWNNLKVLKTLDLSNNKLRFLPTNFPISLTGIDLSFNQIEYITPNTFNKLTNLKSLNLSNTGLVELPRGIQSSLEFYDVSGNRLTTLYDKSQYDFCTRCKAFLISNNSWHCGLELVRMLTWMSEQGELNKRNDSQNVVMCQGKNILSYGNIQWQEVLSNVESWQNKNVQCKYTIYKLNCTNQNFSKLPVVSQMSVLEIVILSGNRYIRIPDYFYASMHSLLNLTLSNNHIKHLPKGLSSSIIHLDLSNNHIEKITKKDLPTLANLTNLKYLDLSKNRFKTFLSRYFLRMTSLEFLGFKENQIECDCNLYLFASWYNRSELWKNTHTNDIACSQEGNRNMTDILTFSRIDRSICLPIPCTVDEQIMLLDCSQRQANFSIIVNTSYFSKIHWEQINLGKSSLNKETLPLLTNQVELRVVNLTGNDFEEIPFEKIPSNIEKIIISDNKLERVALNETHYANLKFIDARNNSITRVNLNGKFLLDGNPIVCDCDIREVSSWYTSNQDQLEKLVAEDFNSLLCNSPAQLKGRKVLNLLEREYCPVASALTIIGMLCGIIASFALILSIACYILKKKRRSRVNREIMEGIERILKLGESMDHEMGETVQNTCEYEYDAYVSSSDAEEDKKFVYRMLDELEEKRGFKLCYHNRDFKPGMGIADNIADSFATSRMIIIVISNHYTSSSWCHYQIQTALSVMQQKQRSGCVIPILLEDLVKNSTTSSNVILALKLLNSLRTPKSNSYASDRNWNSFWINLAARIRQ